VYLHRVCVCILSLYVQDCSGVLLSCVSLAFGDHDVTGLFFSRVCVEFVPGRSVHQPVFSPYFQRHAPLVLDTLDPGKEFTLC
jgi:hypothetical protein